MNALIIANTQIRRDAAGRYCLNDLHQASGGEMKHKPANWLRLDQTAELVRELEGESVQGACSDLSRPPGTGGAVETVNDGFVNGTYAVKELVYAYAMWISAKFHLHVIRAYDALVQQATAPAPVPGFPQVNHRADQLVSAGRIFNAALRVARSTRMHPRRALRTAAACSERHTGIDWLSEMQVDPERDIDAVPEFGTDSGVAEFVAAWRAGAVPLVPVLSRDLFDWYREWSLINGKRLVAEAGFVETLKRSYGFEGRRVRWHGPSGRVLFPDKARLGSGEEGAYLGRCVAAFREAIKGAVIA